MKNIDELISAYNNYTDEISKKVFSNRFMWAVTGNYKYVYSMLKETTCIMKEPSNLFHIIEDNLQGKASARRIVLYGAGEAGELFLLWMRHIGVRVSAIADRDEKKIGTELQGVPVIEPAGLCTEYKDAAIGLCSWSWDIRKNMRKSLLSLGIENDRIFYALRETGDQYFEKSLFKLSDDEIFVDGGAYDLGTSNTFANITGRKYKHIYAFEPLENGCALCEELIKKEKLENITVYNNGLWNKSELVHFDDANGLTNANINSEGPQTIKAVALDEILDGGPCTFIKMDIEGSEYNALCGAEKTIRKYHPKLAISTYHKPWDMVDLTLKIKELNPEYKLFMRHYSTTINETVIYAL